MQARPFLRRTPLLAAAALLGLAMAPIPGGWTVQDGSKLVRKPPAGTDFDLAVILNSGPDPVMACSKGTNLTATLVIAPDGVSVQFALPEGAKNVVLRDTVVNGQKVKGTLVWAKLGPPIPPVGGGGGGGGGE